MDTNTKSAEDYYDINDSTGWAHCSRCGHATKGLTAAATERLIIKHMYIAHGLVTSKQADPDAPTFIPPFRNGKSAVVSNSIDHAGKLWHAGASNVRTYKYSNNSIKEV
jgi:hypothetical protein